MLWLGLPFVASVTACFSDPVVAVPDEEPTASSMAPDPSEDDDEDDGAPDDTMTPDDSSDPMPDDSGAAGTDTEDDDCVDGLPCVPDDPCASEGICAADGTCTPLERVTCDEPPGPCFEPEGTCVDGACTYVPVEAGVACDDGVACTVGDTCDGEGTCQPGPTCPSDNPCMASVCEDDVCVESALPEGTACGDEPADRCCAGTCVDTSSDAANCGGCGTTCSAGFECEPVHETSSCAVAPLNTSGRCRCLAADSQCPLGQLCRTVSPYTNRCVPAGPGNCESEFFQQSGCPSFCSYED